MRRIPIPTVVTGLALLLVLVIYAFTFQVRFSEVALKVRFGKADNRSVITEPGLYRRWPWPIERIVKYDKRLHVLDTPETEIKTRDGNTVIVGCYAVWKIADPLQFFVRVVTEREANEKMRARVNEARAAVIGRHAQTSFVSLDPEQVNQSYDTIEREMLAAAAPGIRADFGVDVARVGIRRISLPEETTQKVFESMIQERERTATRYREEGKAIAETIRGVAESRARQILAFANAKAEEIKSTGTKAATRILERIDSADEELFIWLREMEALEAALKENSTIFLDAKEQLFRRFTQPPSATEQAPGAATKAGPAPALPGSN